MYNRWSAILAPKSMRVLSTPLALYCKSYLAATIGPETAEKAIRYSFIFSAGMDEGRVPIPLDEGRGGDNFTQLEQDLTLFFYPMLGILRGLVRAGYSEEVAEEIVVNMLEFAPEEMTRRHHD